MGAREREGGRVPLTTAQTPHGFGAATMRRRGDVAGRGGIPRAAEDGESGKGGGKEKGRREALYGIGLRDRVQTRESFERLKFLIKQKELFENTQTPDSGGGRGTRNKTPQINRTRGAGLKQSREKGAVLGGTEGREGPARAPHVGVPERGTRPKAQREERGRKNN